MVLTNLTIWTTHDIVPIYEETKKVMSETVHRVYMYSQRELWGIVCYRKIQMLILYPSLRIL